VSGKSGLLPEERQIINPVHGEDVTTVLLRWAIFGGNVAAVLRSRAAIGLVVGEAVRPRVRKIQQRVAVEAFLKLSL